MAQSSTVRSLGGPLRNRICARTSWGDRNWSVARARRREIAGRSSFLSRKSSIQRARASGFRESSSVRGSGERLLWGARRMSKILRNAPIRTWEAGDSVQGFALLTKKEQRQDRNGKSFLDMELADASGSMVAKVWADSPALNARFEPHQFVAFRGSVKSYRDQLQLSVD